jgi:hypothetical protein
MNSIFIPERGVRQQVADLLDAPRGKQFSATGTDTLQVLDRSIEIE